MKALLEFVILFAVLLPFTGVTFAVTPETVNLPAAPELIQELPVNESPLTVSSPHPSTALIVTFVADTLPVIVRFLSTVISISLIFSVTMIVSPLAASLIAV